MGADPDQEGDEHMTELLMTQVAEAPIWLAVVAYLAARAICEGFADERLRTGTSKTGFTSSPPPH